VVGFKDSSFHMALKYRKNVKEKECTKMNGKTKFFINL
jgi:hypothetical protein